MVARFVAADFFAVDVFRAAVFFEGAFFAVVFRAVDFFAVVFFAVVLFAVDFFAVVFFAAAFFAGAFFAAVFFAADFFLALCGQPAFISAYDSFETVERDLGRLLPARFFALMLFTREFFFFAAMGESLITQPAPVSFATSRRRLPAAEP